MVQIVSDFFLDSGAALVKAVDGLLLPAGFFLFIGMLTKGARLFADMRRAVAQTSLNVQIMAFNIIIIAPLISVASQGMSELVAIPAVYLVAPERWAAQPLGLVILAAVFVGDFIGYWRHRLEHTRLFWPAHAVHHSDTDMTWLALERFHPINHVTTFVIDTGTLFLLGFPPAAVVANVLVRHYYGYFIHADLPWTFGPLGKVFVSPAMHRWHHAADSAAFNTNYATVFSVFDRAFGTFRVPGPCTVALGVTDKIAPTLRGQIGYAFSPRAYRRLFRSRS